ncbi:MAG: DMT family transporter [Rhodobacteraceae bacterium]|nr:DMT family transporter [Paracoccaceae bacterium]
MTNQAKGLLLTALGVLLVIPDSLFIRLIQADILTIIFWRALLAGLMILFGVCIFYGRGTIGAFRLLGPYGLLFALTMSVGTFCFLAAVRNTSVANALFIVSTSPVFAAITSRVFLGEPFTKRLLWTTVAALCGIGVITVGSSGNEYASYKGDLLAIGAAVALACSFTTARALRHISVVPAAAIGYLATASLAFPLATPFSLVGVEWTYIIVLGAVFIPFGTSLMAMGPRYITAPEVSLLLLLEAVLAPLLVWYVLAEHPGNWALVGGAIVIGALFVSNMIGLRRAKRRKQQAAQTKLPGKV